MEAKAQKGTIILQVILAILLMVDIVLFLGAIARFQRSRLLLS